MAVFFDFLGDLPHYAGQASVPVRMNKRFDLLIAPFADDISGAKVLDLASHDGRWAYALAGAGAAEVAGIEARGAVAAQFAAFPDAALRGRVRLQVGDLFDFLEAEVQRRARYDVVCAFGIFYHIMDHMRLLRLIHDLRPRLVLVDSEFALRAAPVIRLVRERTDKVLNATPQVPGQAVAVKGVPSRAAMEVMADSLGFAVEWLGWPEGTDRRGIKDYFRRKRVRRAACALRPR